MTPQLYTISAVLLNAKGAIVSRHRTPDLTDSQARQQMAILRQAGWERIRRDVQ